MKILFRLYHTLFCFILCTCLLISCKNHDRDVEGKALFITDWEFQYQGQWYPAFVPGYIHTDLIDNKLIPNPFYGRNEDSVQWVSDSCWVYRLLFDGTNIDPNQHPELVFEGVTGYAEFYLNGEPLLNQEGQNYTDNSYRTWRFLLPANVKNKDNELIVKFLPSSKIIKERSRQLPYILPDERVFLRNPPYQAGWDWGPKMVTCGFSKIIYLNQWKDFTISNLHIRQNHLCEEEAHLLVSFDILCDIDDKATIKYMVNDKIFKTVRGAEINPNTDKFSTELTIKHPKLWYPNGMGEQNLYKIAVVVEKGSQSKRLEANIGLRNIELNIAADSIGRVFEFLVNDQPVFMKGVNWIPADFFPTRIKEEQYRWLLQSCKDANMNMIRVWGGGIYEPDIFYDICDELGILVWQDFMYSCALYPGDSIFMHNAEVEAREQVSRLRNHPCLAIWCGNNEVKNGWEDWGWQANYKPKHRTEIESDMHTLFDTLLAEIVTENDPYRPYVTSSPLWGWGHPECCTQGDSHYWGVWWGELPFEMWEEKTGRFMSEYGFQSYPSMATIVSFTNDKERNLNSAAMKNHQKHARGVQIINKALDQYFYIPEKFTDYVYLSQLVQAYGIGQAIEVHRRKQPHCMGTLYWQLNDCWPVASWSSIDYYGRWKALQYEAKRQFEPIILTTAPLQGNELPIYAINDSAKTIQASLQICLCNFDGSITDSVYIDSISLPGRSAVEISRYSPAKKIKINKLTKQYLHLKLFDAKGRLLAQKVYFYLYPKQMEFQPKGISTQVQRLNASTKEEQYIFTLSAEQIKYGVAITTNLNGRFSDNYFTLLPGEEKQVIFTPAAPAKVQMKYNVKSFGKE
ncbi:MAG: glycoside hydrolase family 2 protein [Bacteroidales bacterium]|nr:glycoside hydrolase family 2 protein [Bacteroidales bacterium]